MDYARGMSMPCLLKNKTMTAQTKTSQVNPAFTFTIAKIITHVSIAEALAENLKLEPFIWGRSKDMLNRVVTRCKGANKEITDMLGESSKKVVRDELMTPENYLQIDNIMNAFLAMPDGIRNEIEDYIMARYNVYALNEHK